MSIHLREGGNKCKPWIDYWSPNTVDFNPNPDPDNKGSIYKVHKSKSGYGVTRGLCCHVSVYMVGRGGEGKPYGAKLHQQTRGRLSAVDTWGPGCGARRVNKGWRLVWVYSGNKPSPPFPFFNSPTKRHLVVVGPSLNRHAVLTFVRFNCFSFLTRGKTPNALSQFPLPVLADGRVVS